MIFKKALIMVLAVQVLATTASAVNFVKLADDNRRMKHAIDEHAFCAMTESYDNLSQSIDPKDVKGHHVDQLVKIASISKLFTTYFVLAKFGPTYRFQTKIYLDSIDASTYDVHIAGAWDPYFTFDKFFLLVSELNKLGVKKIRRLSIDNRFRAYLSIRMREDRDKTASERLMWQTDQEKITDAVSSDETITNTKNMMNTDSWSKRIWRMYRNSQNASRSATGVSLVETPRISVKDVSLENDFEVRSNTRVFVMKSPMLIRYLKDMNRYSNNYIADRMFNLAGGAEGMRQFLKTAMAFDNRDAVLNTGSGLPDVSTGSRRDNLATCRAVVTMMESMATSLNNFKMTDKDAESFGNAKKLRLSDVMMVAGDDDGTYGGQGDQSGAVVVKTGTLKDQITLSGYARTKKGVVWFGIFLAAESEAAKDAAREFRQQVVNEIIDENGGPVEIKNIDGGEFSDFFPFDKRSVLTPISNKPVLN